MTFAERMAPSAAFESAVLERLQRNGWAAYPFGQGQLPPECRCLLTKYLDRARRPSLIRWMADIIAIRQCGTEVDVALIDAKVCGNKTDNYSLELSAIEANEKYTEHFFTPTFFVFDTGPAKGQDDYGVLTPREARLRGRLGPENTNGSGTPYVLISKYHAHGFDYIFPPVTR